MKREPAENKGKRNLRWELSICAIILSLMNLLLWFIVLSHVIAKDRQLADQMRLFTSSQSATSSAQNAVITISEIQKLMKAELGNYSVMAEEKWFLMFNDLRGDTASQIQELNAKVADVRMKYKTFQQFWYRLAHKVGVT